MPQSMARAGKPVCKMDSSRPMLLRQSFTRTVTYLWEWWVMNWPLLLLLALLAAPAATGCLDILYLLNAGARIDRCIMEGLCCAQSAGSGLVQLHRAIAF